MPGAVTCAGFAAAQFRQPRLRPARARVPVASFRLSGFDVDVSAAPILSAATVRFRRCREAEKLARRLNGPARPNGESRVGVVCLIGCCTFQVRPWREMPGGEGGLQPAVVVGGNRSRTGERLLAER